ncbi:MAG: FecR family protein [Bacteroidales bacterium]
MNRRKKSLIDYLQGDHNKEGKLIFDRWFRKKQEESKTREDLHGNDFAQLQKKMMTHIGERIREKELASQPKASQKNAPAKSIFTPVSSSLKIAATVAILLTTTFLAVYFYQPTRSAVISFFNSPEEDTYETITTKMGSKAHFNLTDGTQIILNSGSEIRFSPQLSQNKRELFLSGEAYFKVAKDKDRPFIVHAGNLSTTVIGTAFNIKSYENEDDMKVFVEEGKVKVNILKNQTGNNQQFTDYFLEPNEQVVYNKADNQIQHNAVSVSDLLAWKDNVLVFDDQTLEEISRVLERWFDVDITFDNEKLKNCTFRGRSEDPKLYNILEAISYANDITYEKEEKNIVFRGSGCP